MRRLAVFGGKPVRQKKCWQKNKYDRREEDAVIKVIRSGQLSEFRGGPQVRKFEKEYAEYTGTRYAIATTSGTASLHISIAALDLKKGTEVIVPALTFVSTASVVLQEDLVPVFADIDDTFCLDPGDLERKVTKKTKAIIPVHLYGHPANMVTIRNIANKHNLYIIEDAAQSHGAKIEAKKVGSFGDFGCFSFFQTKNLSTGEGGMITTSDKKLHERAKLKKEHGSPVNSATWYSYVVLGYNYNMTELQAAIGRVQLKKLDNMNKQRREIARRYQKSLNKFNFRWIGDERNSTNVYHNFTILIPAKYKHKRDFIAKALQKEGIPVPLYKTKLFKKNRVVNNCPNSELVASRLINLFTNPALDLSLIDDTRKSFEKIFNHLENTNV